MPGDRSVRGLLDRLAGGVGLRRGRRDPRHLLVGDALDFWRVEAITPGSLLLRNITAAAERAGQTRPARSGR